MGYFTDLFNNMNEEQKESFYKNVILNDDSPYGQKVRDDYYKTVLGKMGENCHIGVGVRIVNPQWVYLGDGVQIYDQATLIARGEKGITIGDYTRIKERALIDSERAETGYIKIGSYVYIGTGTSMFGQIGLEIGDYCLLAQNITITPYSHISDNPDELIVKQGGHCEKVTIGKDCYIGMNTAIMYSGSMGEGSVVGAGAVVNKPIPPYSIAVGVPAKVIKTRKK